MAERREPTVRPPAGGDGARPPRFVDDSDGWTLAAELLTATFFWGGVGWVLDGWLETAPVLMALGFVLGNALGVYLIWVRSQDRFTREHRDLLARRGRGVVGDAVAPARRDRASRATGGEGDHA